MFDLEHTFTCLVSSFLMERTNTEMRSQELPAKPVSMLDPRNEYIKCERIHFLCEVSLLVRKGTVPGPPRKENRVLKILCKTLSPMVRDG